MPTEQFKDVRLLEDWETQVRNTQYEFKEGDIVQVPLDLANKIINFFDVEAEGAGNPYEVLEREADEKIGVRDGSGDRPSNKDDSQEEDNQGEELAAEDVENEDDYRQLQKYAEQFDGVDGSQSKKDLRDDLLERL